jgi:hypothetical protein
MRRRFLLRVRSPSFRLLSGGSLMGMYGMGQTEKLKQALTVVSEAMDSARIRSFSEMGTDRAFLAPYLFVVCSFERSWFSHCPMGSINWGIPVISTLSFSSSFRILKSHVLTTRQYFYDKRPTRRGDVST